jgi:hypothetical protein
MQALKQLKRISTICIPSPIAVTHIEDWLRRSGLALCCIVCPLIFAIAAFNWAANKLIPAQISNLQISYQPASGKIRNERATASSSQTSGTNTGALTRKDGVGSDPDPKLYLLGQHISGRYNFSVICAFLYVACASAFIFSSVIVIDRLGWKAFFFGIVAFAILAYGIAGSRWIQNPFDIARPFLVDRVLNEADAFETLRSLATASKTGEVVFSVISVNEFVAVVSVGMIFIGLFALSLRPQGLDLEIRGLRTRLKAIRCAIAFGSAIFVVSVTLTKMLLEWPLSLIDESQATALKPVVSALILQFGATGTIIVFCTFTPAISSWLLDVSKYQELHPDAAKELADESFALAPSSILTSVSAVIAPIVTSPIVDALKTLMGTVSSN